MEEYVTLERFSEFTKLVVNHMETTSSDKKLLNAVKNRLIKAENEVKNLKEQLSKLFQGDVGSNITCSCGITEERFERVEEKVFNSHPSTEEIKENCEDITKLEKEIELVSNKLKEVESKLSDLNEEQHFIRKKQKKNSDLALSCNHCEEKFPNYSVLEKHLEDDHVRKQIKCDNCDLLFHTAWRLKKHMRNHTEKSKRNCYYFNSSQHCPFEILGCKFNHIYSDECKFGNRCVKHMCQFRHS